MKKILLAFQFLTIIPLKEIDVSEEDVGSTSAFFPVVGLVEGLLFALLAALFIKIFPSELCNALLVLVIVIVNGGLHLDGLADTFDAIASRGDKVTKIAIMKDSTVGPLGVTAIVMALLLKYVLLNAVFSHSTIVVYFASVALMPVFSRWTMVPVAYYCKSAKKDGLGRMFAEHTELRAVLTATAVTIAASFLICSIASDNGLFTFHIMFVMPMLYVFNFVAVWFSNKYFEGITGDLFGAVYEIAVLLFLTFTVIWSQKFI
jgi:adenosylcobinamide-GDP ribazoletransferase